MPELPEVETMRRGVEPVVGGRIEAVRRVPGPCRPIEISPSMAAFGRRVRGQRIAKVDRVGKRVVLRLESNDAIVFEPRMTGLLLLSDPPDRHHLRFQIELSGASKRRRRLQSIWFWDQRGLGIVRLCSAGEFATRYGDERLGPDALGVSAETLKQRLGASRRAIKVALLDQRAVAGVGNLYASEALHLAGIDPRRRCTRLTIPQWRRLEAALKEVLEQAILYEGSTLSDGAYRNAFNETGGYQSHHRVYDRRGQPCGTCDGGLIERIVQAQRSTFFCPRCQHRSRR
jgi:formamidopyrimidine-DNA glycosylase